MHEVILCHTDVVEKADTAKIVVTELIVGDSVQCLMLFGGLEGVLEV